MSAARTTSDPVAAPPPPAPMHLQRACACGGPAGLSGQCRSCDAAGRFGADFLQAEFTVSTPGDPFEREADRAAEAVLRGGPPPRLSALGAARGEVPREAAEPDAEADDLQAKAAAALAPGPGFAARMQGAGGGAPLSPPTRSYFEQGFARDFGHVRVHDGATAAELARGINARAFTHGAHIYFGAGQHDAASAEGRRLLAHELAHTVQQGGGVLRRSPLDAAAPMAVDVPEAGSASPAAGPAAPLREVRGAAPATVLGMAVSCADMRLRIDTADARHFYRMAECSLPLGSYDGAVTVTASDFQVQLTDETGRQGRGRFRYRVARGQVNPADLLRDQARVHVDVVEHLPPARERTEAERQRPECAIRLADRVLVPPGHVNRPLFEPINVPPTTIWSHPIPLGQFGFVEVEAQVSAAVSGSFQASYGPGRLTGICLTRLIDQTDSSAPIEHPLLGPGSRADVTTFGIGGRARFNLPARMSVSFRATGRLRIAGDYLSVIELAAAEGALTATGAATLSGSIDGAVEVVARASRSTATLEDPLSLAAIAIEHDQVEAVDLAAEIGLRGRAGLAFRADASAGFSLLGFNLWRQSWNLLDVTAGIGWAGGLRYSPNPGMHFDLGAMTTGEDMGGAEGFDDETLDDVTPHEDAAELDPDDILREIYEEAEASVDSPDGLSEAKALPFDWRKPIELYAPTVALPGAEEPNEVHLNDPPTPVRYLDRGRSAYVDLGVADWPAVGRTFDYLPYDTRITPNQRSFNGILDRLGADRSGFDAEHVWDVKLRGLEWDRFDNLWPASNQEQQLAGVQHDRQIRNYAAALGNINGRWFRIARVRHPAWP